MLRSDQPAIDHGFTGVRFIRRIIGIASVFIPLSLMSGCAFAGSVVSASAAAGAAIGRPMQRESLTVVTFPQPADFATVPTGGAARSRLGDTIWFRGILSVRGRVNAVRGDSVELDLRDVRDIHGVRVFRVGTLRALIQAPPTNVSREESRRPRRVVGAILGAGAGCLLLIGTVGLLAVVQD